MNLWAPGGSQGATYGLENSVQSSARTIAPMISALIATSFGFRGVFAGTAAVYLLIGVVAIGIVRAARDRHAIVLGAQLAPGD